MALCAHPPPAPPEPTPTPASSSVRASTNTHNAVEATPDPRGMRVSDDKPAIGEALNGATELGGTGFGRALRAG
jgi:hypothetical protein